MISDRYPQFIPFRSAQVQVLNQSRLCAPDHVTLRYTSWHEPRERRREELGSCVRVGIGGSVGQVEPSRIQTGAGSPNRIPNPGDIRCVCRPGELGL
ncbi:hypothetical protein BDN72DRAFT_838145 [Pluteus cervinus]|uniref:Uncharacterized protein n=1 Tax=Pluteus cervinus TaxID=181527 RepID=A0ACD3AZL7_9AGAR|nr:hypothetical protein BDN72DRAFT_838145 [Pluteus cervinus]